MLPIRLFFILIIAMFCLGFTCIFANIISQRHIDYGVVIQSSGVWVLEDSVFAKTGIPIILEADNITLDLQGHTLDGFQQGSNGIFVKGKNCVIKNGVISGFSLTGLSLHDCVDCLVSNITINKSHKGIEIIGGSNVQLQQLNVHNCTAFGIDIFNTHYVHIVTCDIIDCFTGGLSIHGDSQLSFINGLNIQGCCDYGVCIESDDIHLTCITVENSGMDGVVIIGNNIVCNSIISVSNNGSGFFINAANIIMRNCIAGYNLDDGLRLGPNSSNVQIIGGIYSGNNFVGVNNYGVKNSMHSVDIRVNGQRDFVRIFNAVV